jgi:hypothetical protein
LNRTGRRPTFNACSDARAARFAERVEANVATARISVPPAVAKEAIVLAFDIGGRLLLQFFVGRHARVRGDARVRSLDSILRPAALAGATIGLLTEVAMISPP